jgi:hypothetical protein
MSAIAGNFTTRRTLAAIFTLIELRDLFAPGEYQIVDE